MKHVCGTLPHVYLMDIDGEMNALVGRFSRLMTSQAPVPVPSGSYHPPSHLSDRECGILDSS